ncbi:MAG: preprotein translocase subunit YajC [Erythrobacter sp.]|uniref:preprotein translocase subunit YajC n=1 Tax=Erythrobacter sp. TaxID=1042 RepID=UPI002602658B|nr:preprotein translocase subunit YajC [Erythrobacter sp.]MDJ0977136.1 preprotein translocase subunit YajC [Erythrobacter sp.]
MLEIMIANGAAAAEPPAWLTFMPIIGMVVIFYFLLFRPQMRQQKEHREKIAAVKKGDQVVTAGGLVGKVAKVDDEYVEIDIAKDVRVKAIKQTIGDIIPPGGKPAND